jgi:hypothetical protein
MVIDWSDAGKPNQNLRLNGIYVRIIRKKRVFREKQETCALNRKKISPRLFPGLWKATVIAYPPWKQADFTIFVFFSFFYGDDLISRLREVLNPKSFAGSQWLEWEWGERSVRWSSEWIFDHVAASGSDCLRYRIRGLPHVIFFNHSFVSW